MVEDKRGTESNERANQNPRKTICIHGGGVKYVHCSYNYHVFVCFFINYIKSTLNGEGLPLQKGKKVSKNISYGRSKTDQEVIDLSIANLENELQDIVPMRQWNYDKTDMVDDSGNNNLSKRRKIS